jgi:hypothetical protein
MIGLRAYLAVGAVLAAVAGFYWIRADAANDREKQLRSDAVEHVVIDIREDQESDNEIDKKSGDDLRRELNRWLRQ